MVDTIVNIEEAELRHGSDPLLGFLLFCPSLVMKKFECSRRKEKHCKHFALSPVTLHYINYYILLVLSKKTRNS